MEQTATPLEEAGNPATSPRRLAHLARSRHRDVRAAALGNPNVASATIDAVGMAFPEQVAANPLLRWLAVEDPDFLGRWPRRVRERVLSVTEDVGLLWWAARFGKPEDARAILVNHRTPTPLVAFLAQHADPAVASLARSHVNHDSPNDTKPEINGNLVIDTTLDASDIDLLLAYGALPAFLFPVIARNGTESMRRHAVLQPGLRFDGLERLLIDDDATVRELARKHPNAPAEWTALFHQIESEAPLPEIDAATLEIIAGAATGVAALTRRADVPAHLLERFVLSSAWKERELAAQSPSLDAEHVNKLASDSDADVRAALASNPRCTDVVLALLGNDREEKVRKRVIKRPVALTPEVLAELDAFGAAGQLIAARHPDIGIARLATLARSDDWRVREACALHPRSPAAVLDHLSRDNDSDVRKAVARHASTPAATRTRLASDSSATVRLHLAESTTSKSLFKVLAADSEGAVRAALLRNPAVTPAIVATISEHHDVDTARELAKRDDLAPSIMLDLAAIDDLAVRQTLAVRPDRVDGVLERLLDPRTDLAPLAGRLLNYQARVLTGAISPTPHRDVVDINSVNELLTAAPWFNALLFEHDTIATELLETAVAAKEWKTRHRVARMPSAPTDLLERLATDSDYDVRSAVAANPATPMAIIVELVHDANATVRKAVATRPDLAEQLIEQLALDLDDGVRAAALANDRCPPVNVGIRQALDEQLPIATEWFERLVIADGSVPVEVARHPDIPVDLLRTLAASSSWRVREAVALNPRTPVDALETLAIDNDRDVRRGVAAHHAIPLSVRLALTDDDDVGVRNVALSQPDIPAERRAVALRQLLVRLSRSFSIISRAAAVASPELPPIERRRRGHWQSIEWLERLAVAKNPLADPEILERLAEDGHATVRAVAQAASQGRQP